MEMTVEQKRALALASARLRLQDQNPENAPPQTQPPNAAAQIANDHITKSSQAVAGATPAQAIAGNPVTRFAMGAADPIIGAYQLQMNLNPLAKAVGFTDAVNEYIGRSNDVVQSGRDANNSQGIDFTRIGGAILSPANKVVSAAIKAPTLLKNVAGGAVSGTASPVVGGEMGADEFLKEKATQAAFGGAGGALGTALARVVQPLIPTDAAKKLMDRGVVPTPGQAAGADSFLGRVEQKLMSTPLIGDIIKSARDRATNEFDLAAINQSLPKNAQGTITKAGRDAISKADEILGNAYDNVYGSITVRPDGDWGKAIATIRNSPDYALPPELQKRFTDIISMQFTQRTSNGGIPGLLAQRADSNIGQMARNYLSSSNGDERMLGLALRDAQKAFKEMVERSAGPDVAETIKGLNRNYADFLRVERAASMQGAKDGVFSGDQLSSAVRALDTSRNKGNFAQGRAPMQELSDAGKAVLGGTVNNSGTADRAAIMAALGALSGAGANEYFGGPGYLTALALSPALYSRTGSRYASGALPGQSSLSSLLESLAPNMAQGAAGYARENRR